MNKIILILAFLFFNSCNGQENNKSESKMESKTTKKENTMEKFNIKRFEENKSAEDGTYKYIDADGNEVREIKDETSVFENGTYTTKTKMNGYLVEINVKNSLFDIKKGFFPSGSLQVIGIQFRGGFSKGIWKEYDEKGKLHRETDYDLPYKNYPWEKVEEFLKNKDVKLTDPLTSVWRDVSQQNIPMWYLEWDTGKKNVDMFQIIQNIEIDANTGNISKEYQTFREP